MLLLLSYYNNVDNEVILFAFKLTIFCLFKKFNFRFTNAVSNLNQMLMKKIFFNDQNFLVFIKKKY